MWITDAYFLSVPILTKAIMAAARDEIDVRVLLPATNDLPLIGALSHAGYRPLLESGVPMIHAKTHVAASARVGESEPLQPVGELGDRPPHRRPFFRGADGSPLRGGPGKRPRVPAQRNLRPPSPRPLPERPIIGTERRYQRHVSRCSLRGSSGAATVSRVGGEAPHAQERKVGVALSIGALGLSLLGVRYPRLAAAASRAL